MILFAGLAIVLGIFGHSLAASILTVIAVAILFAESK